MVPLACKVVSTYSHDVSVWTIIYRLLHVIEPHLGGINDDIQHELDTLKSNQGDKVEELHGRIIRLNK